LEVQLHEIDYTGRLIVKTSAGAGRQ